MVLYKLLYNEFIDFIEKSNQNILIQRPSSSFLVIRELENDKTLVESSIIERTLEIIEYEEFISTDINNTISQKMKKEEIFIIENSPLQKLINNSQDLNASNTTNGQQNYIDKNISDFDTVCQINNKIKQIKSDIPQQFYHKDQYSSNGSNTENDNKLIDTLLFNIKNNYNSNNGEETTRELNGSTDLKSKYMPAPRNNSKKKFIFSFGENALNLLCNQKKKQEYGVEENTLRTNRTRSESMSFRSIDHSKSINIIFCFLKFLS